MIAGAYTFGAKPIAFRNDFCLSCGAERLAIQLRGFEVAHIYGVPLIPLGFARVWRCLTCGRDPHQGVRTRRLLKVALLLVIALVGVAVWEAPASPDELSLLRVLRLASVLAFGWALWWATVGHRSDPSLSAALALVPPYQQRTCPLCNGSLYDQPVLHCPRCAVQCVRAAIGG